MTAADREREHQVGQILPLFALLLALLLLPVTALAVDGGLLLEAHANLQADVQASAEAGAQAVDVTALDSSGRYELCGVPEGGSSCGNGIGDVAEVVSAAAYPGSSGPHRACALVGYFDLSPVRGQDSGCELALLPACPSSPATGVKVLSWTTVAMPLLGFGPWSAIVSQAEATAWLAHGYSTSGTSGRSAAGPC